MLTPDSTGWAKELSWVAEADISSPAKQSLYTLNKAAQGDQLLHRYVRSDGTKSGVQEITLSYEPVLNELKQVVIVFVEDNTMYRAHRKIYLDFAQDDAGETWLQHYRIAGSQEIIMQEESIYDIAAEVQFAQSVSFH